jgi:ubiquinone/menaquinone biosynthesis C-methylase UbiE
MKTDVSADASTGQVSTTAAEVYEKFFVPALFCQWVEPMLDAVNPVDGDRLLDIGTGTGVVARAALRRVGAGGSVVAVDPNDGMLAVAKRLTPGLDLRRGTAEHLPIDTDEIDCVTCQFALMYFQDRARAISEIARVTRPGSRVAVATWAAVEESPGYAAMVELVEEEIGDWAADALRAPFCLGAPSRLATCCGSRSKPWQWSATTVKRDSRHSTTGCTPRSGDGRSPNTSTTTSMRGCGVLQRRGLRALSPATGPCDSRRQH